MSLPGHSSIPRCSLVSRRTNTELPAMCSSRSPAESESGKEPLCTSGTRLIRVVRVATMSLTAGSWPRTAPLHPLAESLVVHGTSIDGAFTVQGGGGGTSCQPTDLSPFGPYTNLDDSQVNRAVSIAGLSTCRTGVMRNTVNGTFKVNDNTMGDPDAIEIGLNVIHGTLACARNALAFPGSGGVPTYSFDGSPPNPNGVTGPRRVSAPDSKAKRNGSSSGSSRSANWMTPLWSRNAGRLAWWGARYPGARPTRHCPRAGGGSIAWP